MNLNSYSASDTGTLLGVAEVIAKNKSRCAIILRQKKVIGVVSEGDLVRALINGVEIHSPVAEFVHHGFEYMEEKNFEHALNLFRDFGISLIPIVSKEMELKDIITLHDILDQVEIHESGING